MTHSILIIGKLPPPVGGTTVSFETLKNFLEDYEDYMFFNLSSLSCKGKRLHNLFQFFKLLVQSRCWSFHVSDSAAVNILPFFFVVSRVTKKKMIYRQFGGSITHTYSGLNHIQKYLFLKMIQGAEICYFQTKYIINFFESICSEANLKWLPTHRPLMRYTIDHTRFTKKKLQLVYIGRIHSSKGVSLIMSACANLDNIELTLYGPIESECDIDLNTLPNNVYYGGVLSQREIHEVLLQSDLMLLVSSHKGEGYAGAIIDAIQTQTPMILSDITPFREIVSEEQAIFIGADNQARLCAQIREIRDDRRILANLSRRLLGIRSKFDSNVILEQLHKEHCECVD